MSADEIYCGLLLDRGKPHIPTAMLDPEIAKRTITLMTPSKTYNLPGFVRLNFGYPKSTLNKALDRLKIAMEKIP